MERARTEPRLVYRCVISASVFASLLCIESTGWAEALLNRIHIFLLFPCPGRCCE